MTAKKDTKLTEKPTRMPETREEVWHEIISHYLEQVRSLNSESARSHRFGMVVQKLLDFEPGFIENYVTGIEKYVKVRQKDRILKGRVDNLFGNVVIEFEADIVKKRAESEEQLCRYVAILWSQEPVDARRPYLCIATDGVRFITFSPRLLRPGNLDVSPSDVELRVLETVDWKPERANDIFYWLDRHFLRKERLTPNTETIVREFGAKSHAFQVTTDVLLSLWRKLKPQSSFAVVYESWEKYLRIVYGSEVAADELFVRHTYLATLAKVMSWMRLTESNSLPDESQIAQMLEGELFKRQRIDNFIEEDFFSWLSRGEALNAGVASVRWLFSLLQHYNLAQVSEDVLKSLYQELVDPTTRHDLGEFYTPDWLAHRIVNKLLDTNPQGTVLDPACGSGTFLYLAVQEKRGRLGDSLGTLNHILDSVSGADVHPLAVIIAKTNYVLALSELLKRRRGRIAIPVYLADTIRLPEFVQAPKMTGDDVLTAPVPGYRLELDGHPVHLPRQLIDNAATYDAAVELAKDFARQNRGVPTISEDSFRNYLHAQRFPQAQDDALVKALFDVAVTLKDFIDQERDTIWAFVLKNSYKPFFFKDKFDFIVGNPPWISFRYMDPTYQEFLKRQIATDYKLLTGRGELITHMEIATLFLLRAADLYLKSGGTIAFVLPKSLFTADQHDGLRRRTYQLSEHPIEKLYNRELWDCEKVEPLFNVPSCVVIAERRDMPSHEDFTPAYQIPFLPIPGEVLSGKLPKKNASLNEAEQALTAQPVEFSLQTRGKRSYWAIESSPPGPKPLAASAASYYKKLFFQGATIVPRSFWFVRVKTSPLGFDPDLPPLETDPRAIEQAKPQYKDVRFEGNVESRFLYATLLSTDLLPFGHLDCRLVVLPIEPQGHRYKLVRATDARERGFLHLARWVERAESEWVRRRAAKSEGMSTYDRLDRVHGLTRQGPDTLYRVLYGRSGTFLTAAVVETEPLCAEFGGQAVAARGLLVDNATYGLELSAKAESHYVAAMLNAPVVDSMIKPMQSRGQWGPRDIHKKVLELPIPKFDPGDPAHQRLSELGKTCSAKVTAWVNGGGPGKVQSIGRLRGMVRQMLKPELEEIDALVRGLLAVGDSR